MTDKELIQKLILDVELLNLSISEMFDHIDCLRRGVYPSEALAQSRERHASYWKKFSAKLDPMKDAPKDREILIYGTNYDDGPHQWHIGGWNFCREKWEVFKHAETLQKIIAWAELPAKPEGE